MNITRTTHRTDKIMRVDVRFDTSVTGSQQLVNYRVYLTGASKLKHVRITGISVYHSISITQTDVIDFAGLADFVLTLNDKYGKPVLSQYPLWDLMVISENSNGIGSRSRRTNIRIDPDQSYVQLLNTAAVARTRNDLIPLMFWYTDK